MPDSQQFQRTLLREVADIHAQLAILTDFVFSTQSRGVLSGEKQQKALAQRMADLSQKKFRVLCEQAGVALPPDSHRS